MLDLQFVLTMTMTFAILRETGRLLQVGVLVFNQFPFDRYRGEYKSASYERYAAHNEQSTVHKLKETYWTTKQVTDGVRACVCVRVRVYETAFVM